MRRILVTGSRNWSDREAIEQALLKYHPQDGMGFTKADEVPTLVSGGCPTGADRIAEIAARFLGWNVEVHPADWSKHGKAAGPIRNAEMVGLGADVCLAFPEGDSRGTRNCMRLAREAGIPVVSHEKGTND